MYSHNCHSNKFTGSLVGTKPYIKTMILFPKKKTCSQKRKPYIKTKNVIIINYVQHTGMSGIPQRGKVKKSKNTYKQRLKP